MMIDFEFDFRYEGEKIPALKNVQGEIGSGKCIVLCGGSGCGKSTLLCCMLFTFRNGVEVGTEIKSRKRPGHWVLPDASAAFSVCGNRMILRMEICEELRYNFEDRLTRESGIWRGLL